MRDHGAMVARRAGATACLLCAMVVVGCTSQGPNGSPQTGASAAGASVSGVRPGQSLDGVRVVKTLPEVATGGDYAISSDDLLEIDVFQVDQLDRTVRVAETGQITLPLIGEVAAAGRTSRALELELQRLYGANYLESPEISVFVKESVGQRVAVDGAVRKPGVQAVTASSSLVSVIAEAGGLAKIADGTKVYVFRKSGEERLVAQYDLKAVRAGRASDPRIYGGDVVYIFDSKARVAMQGLREALGLATGAASLL